MTSASPLLYPQERGAIRRPLVETVNKKGGRLSFKTINNSFLLAEVD